MALGLGASLALPAPSAFPAPTGHFPLSLAQTDPTFGQNPYTPQNMYVPHMFDPTQGLTDIASRVAQQTSLNSLAQAATLKQVTGADVGSPSQWSLGDAQQQTDAAIAKISTANPELAQKLMEQRTPGEDSGGGFLDSIGHLVGDVFKPALSIGGKLLDIVGRTANIIPNMVYDATDGQDGFNPFKDFGSAMAGNVRHNWNSVFQLWGWDGDGFGGFMRATLGFAGDLATDPLTYLLGAGAGVKSGEAATKLAELAATKNPELVGKAMEVFAEQGLSHEEAAAKITTVFQDIRDGVAKEALNTGQEDLAERAAAAINTKYAGAENDLYRNMFETYDRVFKSSASKSMSPLLKNGTTLSDGTKIEGSTLKSIFDQAVKDGAGSARDSAAWMNARAVASSVGGTRFHFAVPFTSMRYISPAMHVPFTSLSTIGHPLESGFRFFSGQSGMNRLVGQITDESSNIAGRWDLLQQWMQGGWKEMSKTADGTIALDSIRSRFKNLGSALYSASDTVGGLTAAFSPESRALRAGTGGYMAYLAKKAAQDASQAVVDRTAAATADIGGRGGIQRSLEAVGYDVKNPAKMRNDLPAETVNAAETVAGTAKNPVSPERMLLHDKYADFFPTNVTPTNDDEVIAYFNTASKFNESAIRDKLEHGETLTEQEQARLARSDSILQDMKETAGSLSPAEKQAIDQLQQAADVAMSESNKVGAGMGNVKIPLREKTVLHPSEVDQFHGSYAETPADLRGEHKWYIHDTRPQARTTLDASGVTDEALDHGEDGYGVTLSSTRLSPDDKEVVLHGDLIRADQHGDAYVHDAVAGSEGQSVNEMRQGIHDGMTALGDMPVNAGAPETLFSDAEKAQKEAEMLTAQLKASRPDAHGIVRTLEDGTQQATIWDPRDVKVLGDEATEISHEGQGFFHRTLNAKAFEWLRGSFDDEQKFLLKVPQIRSYISRQFKDKTLEEANASVRDYLTGLAPHADAAELPKFLFELNPMMAHAAYVTDVADGVAATIIGDASRRFQRMGDLVPEMFGRGVRGKTYEWDLKPEMAAALKKMPVKVQQQVARALKLKDQVNRAQHESLRSDAQAMGEMSAAAKQLDDLGMELVPDRLTQLEMKYAGERTAAKTAIDAQVRAGQDRLSAIAQERARIDQARKGAVEELDPLKDSQVKVPVYHGAPVGSRRDRAGVLKVAPTDRGLMFTEHEPFAAGVNTQRGGAARVWTVRLDIRNPLDQEGPIPDDLFGRIRRAAASADPRVQEALRKAEERAANSKLTDAGYWYADAEHQIMQATNGELGAHELHRILEGAGYDGTRFLEGAPLGADKAEYPVWVPFHDEQVIYTPEGMDAREAAFDQLRNDGNAYLNSQTGSVYTKHGVPVQERGGSRLRTDAEMAAEEQTLNHRLEGLRRDQAALESGEPLERVDVPKGTKANPRRLTPEQAAQEKTAKANETLARSKTVRAQKVRAAQEAKTRLTRLQQRYDMATAEAGRLQAEQAGIRARLKPALVSVSTQGGLSGYTPLHIPGLEEWAMPDYIAAEFHGALSQHGSRGLQAEWRKYVLGPWKRWATYRNPGFHVRNFFGAWFNNFLGGVTHRNYEFARKVMGARDLKDKYVTGVGQYVTAREFDNMRLGRVFGEGSKGKLTYSQVASLVDAHGIGRANTSSVLGVANEVSLQNEVYDALRKSDVSRARKVARTLDGKMRDVGSGVEDFHRLAAWGAGMSATGGDINGARMFTMMRHGDYGDLTSVEDHIRDLVPFYKWLRTNTPYQIRMLAEYPGQMTLIQDKLKTYAYDVAGVDRQTGQLQEQPWMATQFAIPVPSWMPFIGSKDKDHLKYAVMGLPYSDLYNGVNDYLASALPIGRNFIESYGFGESAFSGKPLDGSMVKLSSVFDLPGVRDVLSALPGVQKGADGKTYIQDKLQNVLMGFPFYARFRNFLESDPARASTRLGTFTSWLTGTNVMPGDATAQELDFFYNEVEPQLNAMRTMGVEFPTMDSIKSVAAQGAGLAVASDLPGPISTSNLTLGVAA